MTNKAKITIIAVILLTCGFATKLRAAGHFAVAFQRQLPAWENSAGTGCMGGHVCRVWVWNEAGQPVPNIQLKTTWDILMGQTDADGRAEIPVNMGDDFDLVCVDGSGATSDATRLMTSNRPECWGHYSFEVGFLYKTDASNPGEFDLDMNCTWNEPSPAPQDDDAPYTKSLAYNGVDCTDYWSDQSYWGNWQNPPSYFCQTFVATGDRVVAVRVQGTIGGNDLLDWKLRIVTFPELVPVGLETSVPVRWPFGWEAFWGVNDCPVVPGKTYMLQVWRDGGGMNIYHVTEDVYPHGQYYEGATAFPGYDLNGHICCMSYGGSAEPNSLVAHWKLDETAGNIAYDSAGDQDGTVFGAPLWQPAGGAAAGALQLDGVDDYVSTGFVLNPADGNFSALAWIKGGEPAQVIISQADGTGTGKVWLCLDTSSRKLMTTLTDGHRFTRALVSASALTEGDWHHVGVVWDGSRRRLFKNGNQVAEDAGNLLNLVASDGGLYFGAGKTFNPDYFWCGLLDDVRVYDYALGTDEIARILCPEPIKSDLNNDCKVNFADVAILLSEWLKCNLPSQESCR
jgi:hypothetical protein